MSLRLVVLLFLAPAIFAQGPVSDSALESEAALGALMAKQFRERHGAVDIPEVTEYLERIVGELAAAQPGEGPCCSVALYASPEAPGKPVGYPGGYVFVPARLFFTSADEEAFVRTLAHAIAHVRGRDWAGAGQAGQPSSVPLTFVWSEDDEIEGIPLGMRTKFEAREARADQAAAESTKAVTMGTGEFEQIRDLAPLPTPRPSLRP